VVNVVGINPSKCIVWFQKISIPPPPRKVTGNSEGEGGSKAENFRGEWGVHRKLLFQRVKKHEKLKATHD